MVFFKEVHPNKVDLFFLKTAPTLIGDLSDFNRQNRGEDHMYDILIGIIEYL